MRIPNVLFILGMAIPGCGGGMMAGSGDMRGAVGDAIDEGQTHVTAARTVATMQAMFDDVDRHTSRMDAIMDDMGTDMESMRGCSGIESMRNLRDGMRTELDVHTVTIHTLANIDDARAEVEHHVGTMGTMLGDMGTMLDGTHCSGS